MPNAKCGPALPVGDQGEERPRLASERRCGYDATICRHGLAAVAPLLQLHVALAAFTPWIQESKSESLATHYQRLPDSRAGEITHYENP